MITDQKNKRTAWQKYLSVLCIIMLMLSTLIGCTSNESGEDVDALREELFAEINALTAEGAAAKREIDSLKNDRDAALKEIAALKTANISGEQKLNTLRVNYEAALQKINELKNSYDTENRNFDALKASYDEAKAEFNALKESYDALTNELEALKNSDDATAEELEALKSAYEEATLEIEALKARISELENMIIPKKIKIYIDQGHNPTGYYNSGATGGGLYEQDITFSVGKLLAELLEADGRFEICLSRPTEDTVLGTDNPTSLEARVAGAEAFGADYFISLHVNASDSADPSGIEVHVFSESSEGYKFGSALLGGMIASTGMRDRGMKISPDLYVIKHTTDRKSVV